MNDSAGSVPAKGGRFRMRRSRGAASGLVLIALGAWGAAAPFIGPWVDFAFYADAGWTAARGWLEVLPGIAAVVGGCLLVVSRHRATAMLGGWLAVAAGAWFVVGRAAASPLGLGAVGEPTATTAAERLWLDLAYFSGLGALIVLVAAFALGRVSVRSVRDVEYAQRTATVMEDVPPAEAEIDPPNTAPTAPTAPTSHRDTDRRWSAMFGRRRDATVAH